MWYGITLASIGRRGAVTDVPQESGKVKSFARVLGKIEVPRVNGIIEKAALSMVYKRKDSGLIRRMVRGL